MITILLIITGVWALSIVLAAWRLFIKRQLDGASLDRAAAGALGALPFLNRARRRQLLRAFRHRNVWERRRQGFGDRGSWRGLMHRSRLTVKLSTPDSDA